MLKQAKLLYLQPTLVLIKFKMKFIFSLIFSAIFFLQSPTVMAITQGEIAPSFELPNETGTLIKLSNYKGKLVYLDFWASWCGPCKQSFPWLNEMQQKYGNKGLNVLAVNLDNNTADALVFLKEVPAKFTVVYDPKAITPKLFSIKGMPSSALIDEQGKVLFFHTGFKSVDKALLEQAIVNAIKK